MNSNETELLSTLANYETLRRSRVLRAGDHCFLCGDNAAARSLCKCSFPESLGCAARKICPDCREGHAVVAGHLRRMFNEPVVQRITSRRARAFSTIREAAEGCGTEGETLRIKLAAACPYEDDKTEFKSRILKAFGQARFAQYKKLADELHRLEVRRALIGALHGRF